MASNRQTSASHSGEGWKPQIQALADSVSAESPASCAVGRPSTRCALTAGVLRGPAGLCFSGHPPHSRALPTLDRSTSRRPLSSHVTLGMGSGSVRWVQTRPHARPHARGQRRVRKASVPTPGRQTLPPDRGGFLGSRERREHRHLSSLLRYVRPSPPRRCLLQPHCPGSQGLRRMLH